MRTRVVTGRLPLAGGDPIAERAQPAERLVAPEIGHDGEDRRARRAPGEGEPDGLGEVDQLDRQLLRELAAGALDRRLVPWLLPGQTPEEAVEPGSEGRREEPPGRGLLVLRRGDEVEARLRRHLDERGRA